MCGCFVLMLGAFAPRLALALMALFNNEITKAFDGSWVIPLIGWFLVPYTTLAYVLLAVSLRSYTDPLLILLAIPFGLTGAVAAHAILGLSLSGFSIAGTIALMGVVVNDSLVLLHGVRELERDGLALGEALRRACKDRFRPILLTSLTTFFGLLPLLFEPSAQAAWLKPVAAALALGVLFATAVTLLVVPAAAMLLADGKSWLARQRAAPGPQPDVGGEGFPAIDPT